MYSDTWPAKDDFWVNLLGEDCGRLGLFHFIRRITRTLRTTHMHFNRAINDLLLAIYEIHPVDLEKLLTALKNGSLNGIEHDDEDIEELQSTKQWRERYGKYLRKLIRLHNTIVTNLSKWFSKYKCTASDGKMPAEGEFDDRTGQTLFTFETKDAVENCKKNARYLQDNLPLDQMYREVKPPANSKHGLSEWISFRGESKLESWHDNVAHFANSGMNRELCDVLNLAGTARYNLTIRHRLKTHHATPENEDMPVQWRQEVSFWNQTELAFINKLAQEAGADYVPFVDIEVLPPDNGERFFSEYLQQRKEISTAHPNHLLDTCPCATCTGTRKSPPPAAAPAPEPAVQHRPPQLPPPARPQQQLQAPAPARRRPPAPPPPPPPPPQVPEPAQWAWPPPLMFPPPPPIMFQGFCCNEKWIYETTPRRGRRLKEEKIHNFMCPQHPANNVMNVWNYG